MKNPQALCYNKFRLRTEGFFFCCGRGKYEICVGKQVNFIWKKEKSMKLRTRVIISFSSSYWFRL